MQGNWAGSSKLAYLRFYSCSLWTVYVVSAINMERNNSISKDIKKITNQRFISLNNGKCLRYYFEKKAFSLGCHLLLPCSVSLLQKISLGRARVMVYRFSALVFVIPLFLMKLRVCFGCCSKPSIWLKQMCESTRFWIQKWVRSDFW